MYFIYILKGMCKCFYRYEGNLVSIPTESTFIPTGIFTYAFQYMYIKHIPCIEFKFGILKLKKNS